MDRLNRNRKLLNVICFQRKMSSQVETCFAFRNKTS